MASRAREVQSSVSVVSCHGGTRWAVAGVVALLAVVPLACGTDGPTPPSQPEPPPLSGSEAPPVGSILSGAELPPLPCPVREDVTAGTVYYIAKNEPGADNESCDGLSPTNVGGGRCPFRDFHSSRTFGLLRDAAGVRVEVRTGTYTFQGEALTLRGVGSNEAERVVLTAYEDESVVLDGEDRLREVVRLAGSNTTVERLTLRNAGAYNVEVRGGENHRVQCNRIQANFRSDSLKGDGGAANTLVRHNDFSQWNSQAIDMTDVRNWTVANNSFHDPALPDAFAILAKLGSRHVRIVDNDFRDSAGIWFGGVSIAHSNRFEAFDVIAENNRFVGLSGVAAKFYSCSNCAFLGNDVNGAAGGIFLSGERFDGPSGCSGGCTPSRGTRVGGNRFRDMVAGLEGGPNTFWGMSSTEAEGLVSGGNLYCVSGGDTAKFQIDDRVLGFGEWTRSLETDESSEVKIDLDGNCAF